MPADGSVLRALAQALLGLPTLAALTTPRSDKFLNVTIPCKEKNHFLLFAFTPVISLGGHVPSAWPTLLADEEEGAHKV